jgi:hypothetical protein
MEDKSKLPKKSTVSSNKNMEALLAENIELNKQILESVNATRKYIKFIRIANILKFLLIFIPLVIALIYVPPLLQKVLGVYDELLGISPFEILQDFNNGQ